MRCDATRCLGRQIVGAEVHEVGIERQGEIETVVDGEPQAKLAGKSGDEFAVGVAGAADGAPSRAAGPL